MAGPTNTEKIDELARLVTPIYPRMDYLERELERLIALKPEVRIAVLEEKIAKLERANDENDRKRWMLTLAVVGTLLTLIANLILGMIRK